MQRVRRNPRAWKGTGPCPMEVGEITRGTRTRVWVRWPSWPRNLRGIYAISDLLWLHS